MASMLMNHRLVDHLLQTLCMHVSIRWTYIQMYMQARDEKEEHASN